MVKYLVIRFSSIGDIILTTPVLRCLKEQVEDAEVHFLTKKEFLPLIRVNPFIDKIHTLDGNMHALLQSLKVEQFDYILDLHKNLRSTRVKSSLKIMSFTVDKINLAKFLMIRFKVNRLPDKHIVDRYMETTRLFEVTNDGKGLDYFIPQEDEIELSSLPETFRSGYIALVVGAMHATKQMPVEKMINICRELDLPVILLGGQRERVLGKEIDKQTGDQVLNTCGQYNINQSASLIPICRTGHRRYSRLWDFPAGPAQRSVKRNVPKGISAAC